MRPCCLEDLESNDGDIEQVENCFLESSCLNKEEQSAVFYISGYVAYKEGLGVAAPENTDNTDLEFLPNVSPKTFLFSRRFVRFLPVLLCIFQSQIREKEMLR